MTKFKFLVLTFILFSTISYSQDSLSYNLKVNYDIYYNTEIPIIKKGVLYIGKENLKSLFIYGKKKEKKISQSEDDDTKYTIVQSGIEKFNFFNLEKDTLYSKEKTFNEEFIVAEKTPQFNWVLEEGEKKFGELALKKATLNFRGRNYIAWYSENYPVKIGPWKFYGLPGLIIEVYDVTKRYHWLATSIEHNKTDSKQSKTINLLEKDKLVDLKYYVEKRYNNNSGFLDESRLPRGTKIVRGQTPRNGIEIKFEWEEEEETKED